MERQVEPRLYIIMRSDIADMNPGKGMAQAAHAQADMIQYMSRLANSWAKMKFDEWKDDRTFGTTTVLSASKDDIESIMNNCEHGRFIIDPTYPWHNWYGEPFTMPELTCAWTFVYDVVEQQFIRQFELHG